MAAILATASGLMDFEAVFKCLARHRPGTDLHPSDAEPPWQTGEDRRCRRFRVPLAGGKELLGTFVRNGDLAFSGRPPLPESAIQPVIAALTELGYVEVLVLGLHGYHA